MAGRYNWGDGHGKAHSIPLAEHKTDVKALHALGGNTDLTAPPTGVQAYRESQAAANQQYGPQVQAAKQLQTNVEPWFKDYMARVAGYAQAAQAQSAPVLGQAQTYQQGAAAQTAPGLDPNSDAGKQAATAAAGRQALAQLGMDALNTQNQATQNYFGGQQAIAAKELPAAMTAAAERTANAKTQRGNAATTFLTTARQNAQNYAIARGTLNLNSDKAAADASQQYGPGATGQNKYGFTYKQWNKLSPAQQEKERHPPNAKPTQGYGVGLPGMNKYGYTYDQWTAMSPKAQAKERAGKGSSSQAGPYGAKLQTATSMTKAYDHITGAQAIIDDLKHSGMSHDDIQQVLLRGGTVQTGTKLVSQVQPDGSHKVVAVPVTRKEPKVDATWLAAALDMSYLGGLSPDTVDELHKSGYLVNRMGLPLAKPGGRTTPTASDGHGGQRPT